jgi:flagellar motor switch protein FliN/FliY
MSNGLSQAEIDALLKVDGSAGGDAPPAQDGPDQTPVPEEAATEAAGQDAELPADSDPEEPAPEDIAAALAEAMPPLEAEDGETTSVSPEEIEAAFAGGPEPAQPKELSETDIAELTAPSMEDDFAPGRPVKEYEGYLTPMEMDAMGEIGNISMGTSATTLFALLNRRVDITTPRVSVTTMSDIASVYPLPFVAVEVQYTIGLQGTNVLFLREHDVKIITDLMMGGDGTNTDAPLNEMHMSCISEVMNQMIGSASTSMSKMLHCPIDISPPQAYSVNLGTSDVYPFTSMDDIIVRTAFDMVVEGLINSEIMQVTPVPFAKSMVETMMGGGAMDAPEPAPAPAPAPAPPPPPPPPPPPAPPPAPAPPPPPPPPPRPPPPPPPPPRPAARLYKLPYSES